MTLSVAAVSFNLAKLMLSRRLRLRSRLLSSIPASDDDDDDDDDDDTGIDGWKAEQFSGDCVNCKANTNLDKEERR